MTLHRLPFLHCFIAADTNVKAKTTNCFDFAMEIMAKNHIFKILHNYFVVVEALSQMRQIQEAMKPKNVNCGKKKQSSI
jgi:hypothetical protein